MPNVADYKIIRDTDFSLTSVGDSMTINFELPPGALLLDNAQRPFIAFSESAGGAGPLTVELELNSTIINTHSYTIDPQMSTRSVIVNGSTFISGQNTLVFTLTSGGGTLTFRNLIVHFQQRS